MNRTLWYSVVGYFVASMAVAWIWHMILFHEAYLAMGAFTRDPPIVPFGVLAIIVQGIVFAWFFPLFLHHKPGGNVVLRGIQFSLFLGLTVYTVMVFATAAKFAIEPVGRFVAYGTAFQFLQYVAVGIVLGLLHWRRD